MHNIILCGGSGTRLWPVSRTLLPKQFIRLFDNRSLFQLTAERNASLCSHTIVVSHQDQFYLALDQLTEFKNETVNFVLEAKAKNTAPAILFACLTLPDEEIVLVTPSDHLITDIKQYEESILLGKKFAEEGWLVTFGINPIKPVTGYGYIETENTYSVKMFHEKPTLEKAKEYLEKGNFLWNSGIFCFKVKTLKEEMRIHCPDLLEKAESVYEKRIQKSETVIAFKEEDVENIPNISIDYALFEKTANIKVVPCPFNWNDLGSFDALMQKYPHDKDKNTVLGQFVNISSKNNFIYNAGNPKKIISAVDVKDLIIVDTADALLVCKKGSSEKVKEITEKIKSMGNQHKMHNTVYRPWGYYTVLEEQQGYKIKKIEVSPGKRLSLQKHYHRNEHWIVLSGTATVQIGDKTAEICPNESIYIKMGQLHRLSNEGILPVVLIEVQVGAYTGEDDIVRFDDDFIRT